MLVVRYLATENLLNSELSSLLTLNSLYNSSAVHKCQRLQSLHSTFIVPMHNWLAAICYEIICMLVATIASNSHSSCLYIRFTKDKLFSAIISTMVLKTQTFSSRELMEKFGGVIMNAMSRVYEGMQQV